MDAEFAGGHVYSVVALHELAACSSCSENYEDAERYLRRAVDVTRKELRDDNIDTIERKCCLSCILIKVVVLDQISLVRNMYRKYRKQTLPLGYLDHIMALNGGRHDLRKDRGGSQKHCFL